MWKKDNPKTTPEKEENLLSTKRDTSGLMGVQARTPGAVSGNEENAKERKAPYSLTDIESTPSRPSDGGQPPTGVSSGAQGTGGAWSPLLSFIGKGRDYFWLLLVNLVLSIITLGIYSFWGKTNIRKYLWSKTQLLGEPLEYTGTGKELFISFLIVMPILFLVMLAYGFLITLQPVVAGLVFYIGLLFAWQFASYRALRYRLTRTRWRGIRGNLSGSATTFAVKATGYMVAIIFTLGLAAPWAVSGMARIRLNNVWFGNRPTAFNGSAKELYKSFLIMMLAIIAVTTVLTGALTAVLYAVAPHIFNSADERELVVLILSISYPCIIIALLVATAFYEATFMRWLFGHLAFGKVRMRSRITGKQVLGLRCTNAILIAITLGLAYAWAHVRTLKLYMQSVDYQGDPELQHLLQDTQYAPSRGEGLLDALDVDIAF